MASLTADGQVSFNIVTAFLVLATVAVTLRLAARLKKKVAVFDSDLCLVASLAALISYCAILYRVLAIAGTFNAALYTLTELIVTQPLFFVIQFLLLVCIGLAKIALLLFYRDIFSHRPFRRLVYGGIMVMVAWMIACILVVAFQCSPVAATYDPIVAATSNPKCFEFGNLVLGSEIATIITDLLLIVLPINEIRKLQMKTSRKIAVSAWFIFGVFIIAVSIARIVVSLNYDGSGTADLPKVLEWSTIQMSCCIICASIPGFPPLLPEVGSPFFSTMASKLRQWRSRSHNDTSAAIKLCEGSDFDSKCGSAPAGGYHHASGASYGSREALYSGTGIHVVQEVSVHHQV